MVNNCIMAKRLALNGFGVYKFELMSSVNSGVLSK